MKIDIHVSINLLSRIYINVFIIIIIIIYLDSHVKTTSNTGTLKEIIIIIYVVVFSKMSEIKIKKKLRTKYT